MCIIVNMCTTTETTKCVITEATEFKYGIVSRAWLSLVAFMHDDGWWDGSVSVFTSIG